MDLGCLQGDRHNLWYAGRKRDAVQKLLRWNMTLQSEPIWRLLLCRPPLRAEFQVLFPFRLQLPVAPSSSRKRNWLHGVCAEMAPPTL
jgi:hypothetical protein